MLTLVQIFIILGWNFLDPPDKSHVYPGRRHLVVCRITPAHLFLAQFYNILLCIFTTMYSYLTRNVTENFNESKWIYFAMYTVCFAWIIDAVVWGLRVKLEDIEDHDNLNPEVLNLYTC